jgi:hypothetical protein
MNTDAPRRAVLVKKPERSECDFTNANKSNQRQRF